MNLSQKISKNGASRRGAQDTQGEGSVPFETADSGNGNF